MQQKRAKQYVHFSFDDVYQCLKDITEHADIYKSVFENEFFAWMKQMHDTYGAVFSLYTFNYFSGVPEYDIADVPSKYAEELAEQADWLKFGFHAKDDKKKYIVDESEAVKADYAKFLDTFMRATNGNVNSIDRVVRLGFCAGTWTNIQALKQCELGLQGLLTADNDPKRISYYFGDEETALVNKAGEYWSDGLLFLRSILRMELITSVEDVLDTVRSLTEPKVIELFSHEVCWYRDSQVEGYSIRELAEFFIKWAYENDYGFDFAQNQYELDE